MRHERFVPDRSSAQVVRAKEIKLRSGPSQSRLHPKMQKGRWLGAKLPHLLPSIRVVLVGAEEFEPPTLCSQSWSKKIYQVPQFLSFTSSTIRMDCGVSVEVVYIQGELSGANSTPFKVALTENAI
jgi:hypothetical protein